VLALSPPPANCKWDNLSFVSTLYLCPILDLLLAGIPDPCQAEVRLGLQEALVNAAKHGNKLDPGKTISVKFTVNGDDYWWIITDQGSGFSYPCCRHSNLDDECDQSGEECGRGLYILQRVFDDVIWVQGGCELHLRKRVRRRTKFPLFAESVTHG